MQCPANEMLVAEIIKNINWVWTLMGVPFDLKTQDKKQTLMDNSLWNNDKQSISTNYYYSVKLIHNEYNTLMTLS